jgi:hypothetical protein
MDREALSHLEDARVVAVLRGGHPQRLYKRGMELSAMPGCGALEVALDTPGALDALRALSKDLPSSVILGAATVVRSPLPTCLNPYGKLPTIETSTPASCPSDFPPVRNLDVCKASE